MGSVFGMQWRHALSFQFHARIENGVRQVDEQIHREQEQRVQEHAAHRERVVALQARLARSASPAGIAKICSMTSEPVRMYAAAGPRYETTGKQRGR